MALDYEPILFVALIGVVVVEMLLSGLWNRWYFTVGIQVFDRQVRLPIGVFPDPEELEIALKSRWVPSLRFHRPSSGDIAFREQAFGGGLLHYTPVMHGVIRRNPAGAGVVIQGLLNWFIVAFTRTMVTILADDLLEFAPFLVGGLAFLYWLQRNRYLRVVQAIEAARAG